jgi:hypothetical protein
MELKSAWAVNTVLGKVSGGSGLRERGKGQGEGSTSKGPNNRRDVSSTMYGE